MPKPMATSTAHETRIFNDLKHHFRIVACIIISPTGVRFCLDADRHRARSLGETMNRKALLRIFTAVSVWLALTVATFATTASVSNFSPSFGTTGTTVIIYGSNFGSRGTVKFNGTSATISSWGATSITAKVPTHATTGVVSVTPLHGTQVSSTAAFVVLASNAGLAMGAFPPTGKSCSGIIGYNGTNCYQDYLNDVLPNIDGVVLVAQWSTIDLGDAAGTGPGCPASNSAYCNWSSLDDAVNDFVTANTCGSGGTSACWTSAKKVGIVISPVSDGGCNGNDCNTSTPAYVFTSSWATTAGGSGTSPLYECTCGGYQGDSNAPQNTCWNSSSNSDTSGFPVVYEAPFSVALQDFHDSVIAHVNSAPYAPYVAYVRLGIAGGGEEYPHCPSTIKSYFSITDSTFETDWTTYANNVFTNAAKQGAQYPLMAAPNSNGTSTGDPSNSWADTEAADALAAGLVLGSEGLQSNDTFISNCDTSTSTDGGSSNNWCYTFSSAFDTNNKVNAPSVKEQQTLMYSDPSENTCTTDYYKSGNTTSENTGSIVCLLPFVQGKVNSVELYPEDVFLAFDSNTTGYSTYGSAYATAISNLRTGN
jgi:hypothetical protein